MLSEGIITMSQYTLEVDAEGPAKAVEKALTGADDVKMGDDSDEFYAESGQCGISGNVQEAGDSYQVSF